MLLADDRDLTIEGENAESKMEEITNAHKPLREAIEGKYRRRKLNLMLGNRC